MNIFNFKYSLVNAFLPIIIICFFLLDSLLHRNVKGLVFLIGLSFSIMSTIFVGNSFGLSSLKGNDVCQPFTINSNSFHTNLPLNPTILIFTTVYLTYTAAKNNFILKNTFFLLIMFLIIVSDNIWLIQNKCYSPLQVIVSNCIGLLAALLWSFIIHKSNDKSIIYMIGTDNNNTCELPKKKTFKCKYKPKQQ